MHCRGLRSFTSAERRCFVSPMLAKIGGPDTAVECLHIERPEGGDFEYAQTRNTSVTGRFFRIHCQCHRFAGGRPTQVIDWKQVLQGVSQHIGVNDLSKQTVIKTSLFGLCAPV